eukprot:403489_1
MGNKQSVARIVFAAAAIAAVSADLTVNYGRNGDYNLPTTWDCSPNWDHNVTYTTEDCCVASCMSTLLHHEENSFQVCRPDGASGKSDTEFEWADHYCDCPIKSYCKFACHPNCETPLVSRYNTPNIWNNFAMRAAQNETSGKTAEDVYAISLRHDSRNLCPVFFFAIYRTPNQVVIDWSQSVLYKPWFFDGEEYTCEKIIVEFTDEETKPVCGEFGSTDSPIFGNPVKCGLRLPAHLDGEGDKFCDVVAEYVAYSSCEFKGVTVFKPVCENPDW